MALSGKEMLARANLVSTVEDWIRAIIKDEMNITDDCRELMRTRNELYIELDKQTNNKDK